MGLEGRGLAEGTVCWGRSREAQVPVPKVGEEEHPSWDVLGMQQAGCPHAPAVPSSQERADLAFLSAVCSLVGVFRWEKYLD